MKGYESSMSFVQCNLLQIIHLILHLFFLNMSVVFHVEPPFLAASFKGH